MKILDFIIEYYLSHYPYLFMNNFDDTNYIVAVYYNLSIFIINFV